MKKIRLQGFDNSDGRQVRKINKEAAQISTIKNAAKGFVLSEAQLSVTINTAKDINALIELLSIIKPCFEYIKKY